MTGSTLATRTLALALACTLVAAAPPREPDGLPPGGVAVTPDGSATPTRVPFTGGYSALFKVKNTGTSTSTFTLTRESSTNITTTSQDYAVVTLAPNDSINVNVFYNAGAPGTGYVKLWAEGMGGIDAGTWNVPVGNAVVVTPDGSITPVRAANSGNFSATFTIQNTGIVTSSYSLSCAGSSNVSCISVSPTQVSNLAAGAQATATATYSTGSAGLGSVSVTAQGASGGSPDNGVYEVPVVSYTVSVTPDNRAVGTLASQTGRIQTFAIQHAGTASATYNLNVLCTGTFVSGCSSPAPVTLASGASTSVNVTYTSGASGTGRIRLLVTHSTNGSIKDSGWVNVAPGTVQASTVSVANVSSGNVVERDLCLTIAAGSGAASECGDLRIVHPLPTIRTMNKARTPTLIYNSQHAQPNPLIAAEVTLPATAATPDSVVAKLTQTGNPTVRGRGKWAGADWVPGRTSRIVVADTLLPVLATGLYNLTLEVVNWYGATPSTAGTATGQYVVVNRTASPFGAGWWVAGLEQLFFPTDTMKLWWVGGDGSFREYQRVIGTSIWRAPSLDHLDSLTRSGVAGGYAYTRFLPHGLKVQFDNSGRHTTTLNRLGHTTTFQYDGSSRLFKILLPPDPTKLYQFVYNPSAGLLDSVIAPPAGTAKRATKLTRSGSRVTAIRDPNLTTVNFAYDGTTNRIASRTDRRGTVTSFTYDAGKKLKQSSIDMGAGRLAIVPRFRPFESLGLAGSGSPSAVDTAVAYAILDGPRVGIGDTTAFWLDRFGAPRRIVNALGYETLIKREDPTFPGLATEVRDPRGFVTQMKYDNRGNPDSVVQVNPRGSGQNDTTRYEWDPAWNVVTKIVQPERDSVVIAYEASTGNRVWQQDGRGSSSRDSFFYYPSPDSVRGLLRSIRTPTQSPSSPRDSIIYNSLGDLAGSKTPLGFWTYHHKDNLGRDTLILSPTDSVNWQRQRFVFNIANQPTDIVSTGPQLSYFDPWAGVTRQTPAETVFVKNFYNSEGAVDSLQRWSRPNTNGINTLTTKWTYDRAGRLVKETAPDAAADSTVFDPSGNPVQLLTRRGHTITLTHDALNRLKQRVTPAVVYSVWRPMAYSETWNFPYFRAAASGGLTVINDGTYGLTIAGETETFSYDAADNLLTADNSAARTRRGYNPNGSLSGDTLIIFPYVGTDTTLHIYGLRFTYDRDGRRTVLTHPNTIAPRSQGLVKDTQTYTYYSTTGLLRSVTDVMGKVFEYTYDLENRVSQLEKAANVLGGVGDIRDIYVYDADGRVSLRTETRGGEVMHADTLVYDARGKIRRARTSGDTTVNTYTGLGTLAWSYSFRYQNCPPCWFFEEHVPDALGNLYESRHFENQNANLGVTADSFHATSGRLLGTWHATGARTNPPHTAEANKTYDAAGNIYRADSWNSSAAGGALVDRTASYYDAAGRLRVQDRQSCISSNYATCSSTYLPEYNDRAAFEEYRYDALGRRILVRTRSEYKCTVNCRNAVTRVVWDGDEVLYEISSPGGTAATVAQLEQDTGQVVQQTQTLGYFPYGRIVYTHGLDLDDPLALYRINYSDVFPEPSLIEPLTNWVGNYDTGLYSGGPINCRTINGQSICMVIDWPAPYLWKTYLARSRGSVGPHSWMGSLIEAGRDASGQLYRRSRYYDPGTGRFTQEDPIGLAGGLNLYGFAAGDPVNFSDPFGLCPPADDNYSDCAPGTPEWYAHRIATGQGSRALNEIGGTFATCGESLLCQGVLLVASLGSSAVASGGGRGAVAATRHGAQRLGDASRLAAQQVDDVVQHATRTYTQRDGARVFVQEVGGRFNVVVRNEAGEMITNLKTVSEKALNRLARRYGWEQ